MCSYRMYVFTLKSAYNIDIHTYTDWMFTRQT